MIKVDYRNYQIEIIPSFETDAKMMLVIRRPEWDLAFCLPRTCFFVKDIKIKKGGYIKQHRITYATEETINDMYEEAKKIGCRIFRASRLTPLTRAPQSWMYVEEEPQ